MSKIILNGITWGHSRGITPLLAFSQRFSELNPGVEIIWKKRTLQEFADFPIEKLTGQFDLLIIDHPCVGRAAATECVLPLDEYLPKSYLDDQLQNSVGYSHPSYHYNDHQWALAIDAATPVASFRADLFQKNNISLPSTWEEVIELSANGKVALPLVPIDMLMNFYMFCIAHGREPFMNSEKVIDTATGMAALATMRQLYSRIDRKLMGHNPVAIAEVMSATDDYWYCPLAYGYSNYSRAGYAENILLYSDLVSFQSKKLRGTIGGTGIAVSAFSNHKELALQFAEQVVSSECQSTLYVENGGQPGHKAAWVNDNANRLCNDFFKNVLPAMEDGYVRPRYDGYLYFQDHGGDPLYEYLLYGGDPKNVLETLNTLYQKSLVMNHAKVYE